MGVDIHFGAEVRKKDKTWQSVVWYSKTNKPDNDGEYGGEIIKDGIETHFYIWAGRAYHYTDALEDMDEYHGYPDYLFYVLEKKRMRQKPLTHPFSWDMPTILTGLN